MWGFLVHGNPYPFADSKPAQGKPLASKEMLAPSALPVCLQIREEVILHRPTQGWTVDEAWILCKVSIYSLTVQPWVGRWAYAMHRSWRLNESSTQDTFHSPTNRVGLALPIPSCPFPSLKTTSRDHLLEQIPRASEFHVRAESFWEKRATWPSNLSVPEGRFSPLAVPRVAPARTDCVAAHLTHIYIAAEFGFDT